MKLRGPGFYFVHMYFWLAFTRWYSVYENVGAFWVWIFGPVNFKGWYFSWDHWQSYKEHLILGYICRLGGLRSSDDYAHNSDALRMHVHFLACFNLVVNSHSQITHALPLPREQRGDWWSDDEASFRLQSNTTRYHEPRPNDWPEPLWATLIFQCWGWETWNHQNPGFRLNTGIRSTSFFWEISNQ